MKGIILAGGTGSRLYPVTKYTSKQLLPVYNKPMIYYPLSTLMLAGVNDVLLICAKENIRDFKKLLGNGNHLGIKISYKIQKKPSGIAEALIIGKKFIKNKNVYLILGDNIFYGAGLQKYFQLINNNNEKSFIFGSYVNNPSQFGVVSKHKNKLKIEEKPKKPRSNIAVTGLYFYKNDTLKKIKEIKKSKRGELEITDFNNLLIEENKIELIEMGRGYAWFDCGTSSGLLEASTFIKTVETIQGIKIGCLEEISLNRKLINKRKLRKNIKKIPNSEYKIYLETILK